jgi:hypothetical protein
MVCQVVFKNIQQIAQSGSLCVDWRARSPMTTVLTKSLHCDVCDETTPLLASSLGQIVGDRSNSSIDETQIFFACPHCKTVGQSSIPVQSERRTIEEGQQHPGGRVPFGVLLECAQRGCGARISVLGATTATDENELRERKPWRTWKFGREVQCEQMHRPAQPPQIAGLVFPT